jgi:hypothetical protein
MSALTASPELQAIMQRKLAHQPELDLVEGYLSGTISTAPGRRGRDGALRAFQGRFTRPRYQRSPDRERSIQRRRQLAATWPMPPAMAGKLTTSQVAYARIVADEFAINGVCDRTLDEIAARGGMSRKTAKRAQQRLLELKWIAVELRPVDGRKHMPNVVTIVSPEWRTWIVMGPNPSKYRGSKMSRHGKPVFHESKIGHGFTTTTGHAAPQKADFRGSEVQDRVHPDERMRA